MKYACSMEMVDVYRQAPNRNRYESKYFWEELYQLVSAGGFDAIELPFEYIGVAAARKGIPFSASNVEFKYGSADKYLSFLKSCGINKVTGMNYSIPGPIYELANYPSEMDAFFGFFGMSVDSAIDSAAKLGCDYVNLSVSPAQGTYNGNVPDKDEYVAGLFAMLAARSAKAAEKGVRLCLRNEYWGVLRGFDLLPYLSELPENVYICVDTANLKIAGASPIAFIQKCAGRIGSVILTDTKFVDDREYYKQKMPEFPAGRATQVFRDLGQGDVDLHAVKEALDAAGYDGYVSFSNRQTRDIFRGILRARYCINNVIEK